MYSTPFDIAIIVNTRHTLTIDHRVLSYSAENLVAYGKNYSAVNSLCIMVLLVNDILCSILV